MTDPAFWQPAEARPQLWRTALGTVLVALIWIGSGLGLVWLGARVSGLPPALVMDAETWSGTAMFFLTFAGLHIGLALALPLLHRRGYASLFGPTRRLHRGHLENGILVTLAMAVVLYAFMVVEHMVLPEGVTPAISRLRPVGSWLLALAPALALIFVQVAAEEAAFRGYLLQQLRARFRTPLIWAVLPALAFGAMHYDPVTYGHLNAAVYVLSTTILGAIAAYVTVRTGNLAAAIGLHFGNNASMVVFGPTGQLDSFSLYGVAMDPASGYTTYSIAAQTVVSVVLFIAWWRWMERHRPIANRPGAA